MSIKHRIGPAHRTLVGQSFGGVFGIYVLVIRPELFENYILTSSSFWYDEDVLFKLEETYTKSPSSLQANVYLAVGEYESPTYGGTRNEMVAQQ